MLMLKVGLILILLIVGSIEKSDPKSIGHKKKEPEYHGFTRLRVM